MSQFQYQQSGIPILPIVAPTIGYAVYPDRLLRARSDVARTAIFEALQPPTVASVTFYEATYPDSILRPKSIQNQRQYFEPLSALFVPNDITNVYPDRLVRKLQEARFEEFNSPFVNPQIPQPDPVYPNQLLRARRAGLSEEFNSPFVPVVAVPTWYESVYPEYQLLRRKIKDLPTEFKAYTGIIAPTIGYADYPDQFTAHYTKRRFERNWRPVAVVPPLPPTESGNVLLACINITESFEQHFTSRGWASPQAQVTAGYDLYIEPSETNASYQEVFDFGSVISNIIVVVDFNSISVVGSIDTGTSTIETSTDGITWSAPTVGSSVFAASVQFVRVTLNFVGISDKSLSYYYHLRCLLNVHREQDGGEATVLAADVGGTVITFNKAFKAIDTINVTPVNTVEQKAVYDFSFPVNPTTFKVLLYNAAGARVNGTITWIARGIF